MGESIQLVLVGNAISLVSTLAGVALQNLFKLLKLKRATRQYPIQVLFNKPTMERTQKCADLLFSFQNVIRRCAGVDAISKDLLHAFGAWDKPVSYPGEGS
ncbi:MAG: hypothetical protein ACUVWX_06740 [Kiritimatiellia bacterium]